MRMRIFFLSYIFCLYAVSSFQASAQSIGDFTSVEPLPQSSNFIIPSTHNFQRIIEAGDALTSGDSLAGNNDFTGYVPINGSSENGYLSISSEMIEGGLSIMDINLNLTTKLWETTLSQTVSFDSVAGTSRNCSGTITPWNTVVSCEESVIVADSNNDGRNDFGWCIEIDPVSKLVIDKLWALGNFKHENIVVHNNRRTVYEGADSYPGYLYKFVADSAEDLSSGTLYVYKGFKDGPGDWLEISNNTPLEQTTTIAQSDSLNATIFSGIEDVEIGPDGLIYFAVKGENRVYRFLDSDPITGTTVVHMETYVGNTSYDITHENGVSSVNWGFGNDNLAFDGEGNLWVLQDGGFNYIWLVRPNHSQFFPKVEVFGRTPFGSEPTGITFSPDYRFLFMSLQHPSANNGVTSQIDAAGDTVYFDNDISLVIALNENLGIHELATNELNSTEVLIHPNPSKGKFNIDLGETITDIEIKVLTIYGQVISADKVESAAKLTLDLSMEPSGIYFVEIRSQNKRLELRKIVKE